MTVFEWIACLTFVATMVGCLAAVLFFRHVCKTREESYNDFVRRTRLRHDDGCWRCKGILTPAAQAAARQRMLSYDFGEE